MSVMEFAAFRMVFGSPRRGYLAWKMGYPRFTTDGDIEVLQTLCAYFKPRRVVEIGVYEGNTARQILEASPWIENYVGVDMLPENLPKGYDQMPQPAKSPGCRVVRDARFGVVLLAKSDELCPGLVHPVDMVFIDGNHDYEAVCHDTKVSRQALRDGKGVLVWHDYPNAPGVVRCVDEYNLGTGGDAICRVLDTMVCFEIARS